MSSAVPHGLEAAELAADEGSCVIAPPIFKIPAAARVPAIRVVHTFAALVALLPDFHDGDAPRVRVACVEIKFQAPHAIDAMQSP